MSSPGNGSSTPEFSDSDLQWFAALTGDQPPDPDAPATREGLALRIALEQRRLRMADSAELATATSDEALQQQLAQLQQRIEREGIFDRPPSAAAAPPPEPRPAQVIAFPWWRRRPALVAMAASVLMAAVVLQQIVTAPDYPPPPEMMGAGGMQKLQRPQPRQAAEAWVQQLQQAGLKPGLYQRGKTYVVDLNLMAADLPAAQPAFGALGLQPAVGFNRLEFGPD